MRTFQELGSTYIICRKGVSGMKIVKKQMKALSEQVIKFQTSLQQSTQKAKHAELEASRANFVNDFTVQKIAVLSIDEYVIGKGKETFCYRLERELKELGSNVGVNALKFGVYYGHTRKDATDKYRAAKKFDNTVQIAFDKVKSELEKLIVYGYDEKLAKTSLFAPLVRDKILYLYYPDRYLPVYSEEHINHFLINLSLPYAQKVDLFLKKHKLLEFKKELEKEFSVKWDNLQFVDFLYDCFGKPSKNAQDIQERKADEQNAIAVDTILAKEIAPQDSWNKHKAAKLIGDCYVYPRNPKVSAFAIQNAGFRCEYDNTHNSFIRKSNGKRYTEVHHLIPLKYYDDMRFDKISLDVPANIVSLCSECHNLIHYGRDNKQIITALYNSKKAELQNAGIDVSLEELLKMYK